MTVIIHRVGNICDFMLNLDFICKQTNERAEYISCSCSHFLLEVMRLGAEEHSAQLIQY